MKKISHLSEEAVLNELQTIINKSPKVNSSKAKKMMEQKDEVEANIKNWGWVKWNRICQLGLANASYVFCNRLYCKLFWCCYP